MVLSPRALFLSLSPPCGHCFPCSKSHSLTYWFLFLHPFTHQIEGFKQRSNIILFALNKQTTSLWLLLSRAQAGMHQSERPWGLSVPASNLAPPHFWPMPLDQPQGVSPGPGQLEGVLSPPLPTAEEDQLRLLLRQGPQHLCHPLVQLSLVQPASTKGAWLSRDPPTPMISRSSGPRSRETSTSSRNLL